MIKPWCFWTDTYVFAESKHDVQTKCLAIDFSDDEEIYEKIDDFLQGLDVGTLVNNVGEKPKEESA